MRYATLALVLTAVAAPAQDTIRSQSRLVQAWAAVTSARELTAADFRLRVGGRAHRIQSVDTFSTGVAPVALAVAVETAGVSATALLKVRKVGAMVQAILTGAPGRVAVLSFDSEVRLIEDFTGSPDRIAGAFAALRPAADPKRDRMLDAVMEASALLSRRAQNRRVLLLISETKDRGSDTALEAALAAAHRAGVEVFAMTYSAWVTPWTAKAGEQPQPGGFDILGGIGELIRAGKVSTTAALVTSTGGRGFTFAHLAALEKAIDSLGDEFRSQYVVNFLPPADSLPGAWHRIELHINGIEPARVRARPGFIN